MQVAVTVALAVNGNALVPGDVWRHALLIVLCPEQGDLQLEPPQQHHVQLKVQGRDVRVGLPPTLTMQSL